MAAQHHELRFQRRIGAGDFGDDVEAVDVVGETRGERQRHFTGCLRSSIRTMRP